MESNAVEVVSDGSADGNGTKRPSPRQSHQPERSLPTGASALALLRRVFSFEEAGVTLALVALVVLIGAFHPVFLHRSSLFATLESAAFVAMVAYGMVFLLAMTDIDLSVGGTYAFSVIVSAKLMANGDINPWIAVVIALVLSAGLGLVNGVFALLLRIPVIIITLGTLSLYTGLVTVISDGQPVSGVPLSSSFFTVLGGNWLGVPVAVWFAVALCAVLTVVFRRTRFGTMVRAVGSNPAAAAFSGIPIMRIRVYGLLLTATLAGIAGILTMAYLQGADPTVGTDFELQVIAAAIIGGTAVTGGSGTVPGALLGALIVSVINSGLVFFSVPNIWDQVVTGAVILIAVGADALLKRRRARPELSNANAVG